jgi:hypothetical protein
MPVNRSDSIYTSWKNKWQTVRDAVSGEEEIKYAAERYLPRPSGQSNDDYLKYITRARWFDGTGRTCEAFHGNLFSKEPVQTGAASPGFKKLLENVDGAGRNIRQFADDISWDAMQTYWGGILVDYPAVPEGTPQARVKGGAYLKWYAAESIINRRQEVRNGKQTTVLIVLREDGVKASPADKFAAESIERYRVLLLDENNRYIQEIYTKTDDFKTWETINPKFDNKPLDFIPFFFCPFENPGKSILLGLAYENIGVYQLDADYKNGLHYTVWLFWAPGRWGRIKEAWNPLILSVYTALLKTAFCGPTRGL